jgi:hypothetical protein
VLREAGGRPPALFKMIRPYLSIFPLIVLLFPFPSFGAGGGIKGSVQYRGESVPGAYVEVFKALEIDGRAVGAANTGSDGRFSLSLPPGSYRLTVKKRPEGAGSGGMLFGTTGSESLVVGQNILVIPPLKLKDMGAGEGAAGEIEVSGSVHGPDGPLSGAYVYFYPGQTRRGPGYLARARTGEAGGFSAGVASGAYTVTVRFSASGDGMGGGGMGTVGVSDLVGDYRANPLVVGIADMELGRIELRPVDPATWEERQWAGTQGRFSFTGTVLTEDRTPLPGAYVFIYDDRRMVGKPVAISAPTSGDGLFSVVVADPGTYFLGARTRYGGPVEPGEYMGAWDEKGPRAVILGGDTTSFNCEIVVREVW